MFGSYAEIRITLQAGSRLRVETLGGLIIAGAPAGSSGHQRRRLALLALLSINGPRGLSRDQIVAYLWPDKNAEDARHSLEQLLYGMRRALGEALFLGVNPIALNPDAVASDVAEFESAIASDALDAALALYRGPFLAGFYLSDAPEFEQWVESERARLRASLQVALERLAVRALDLADYGIAVRWSKQLAETDPLSARYALLLMRALDAAGDNAAALRHARVYEALVRAEFDTAADSTITGFADRLRTRSTAPARATAGLTLTPRVAMSATAATIAKAPSFVTRVNRFANAARARRGLLVAALLSLIAMTFPLLRPTGIRPPAAASRIASAPSTGLEAEQLYRLGQQQWNFRTDSSLRRSIDYYEQAIEKDSRFAAAYAGIATAYAYLGTGNYGDFAPREAGMRAKMAALRAIALDDSLAEAHAALAFVRMLYDYDFAGAESEFRRAIVLDSANAQARLYHSIFLDWIGRFDEAVGEARRAAALDSASVSIRTELGRALFFAERYDEALEELERARRLDSTFTRIYLTVGEIYAARSMFPQAIATLRRTAQGAGRPPRAQALLGLTLARAGQTVEALRILADLKARARVGGVGAFDVATVYIGLRDYDQAFAWLDRAYDDRSLRPFVMDPTYADIRRDRRFDVLLRRMNLKSRT